MQKISFTTPFPPSVNRIYATSSRPKISKAGKIYYPRVLSKEGRVFKKYVSELLRFGFYKVKYGDHPVEIEVTFCLPDDNRTRDDHNCEKILYDAIQESGIINNDKQLYPRHILRGKKVKGGAAHIIMKPYIEEQKS